MLDTLMCSLYELTVKSSASGYENKISGGHEFEEQTARLVYLHENLEGLKANPPRLTLQLPTISGLTYQFDVSFYFHNALFVIECKKRESLLTGSELVHYFLSKIMDYVLASKRAGGNLKMHGIFLSTQDTGDSGCICGLSFGVRVIDPTHPPIEYMLSKLPQEEVALRKSLEHLGKKIDTDFIHD
ncbi:MAG: hypothetical protein NTX81_02545, partial [Candidatus Bathyarchaeota archaeon]|nr:hypothetical protein [Candidatus Bathyarchaeota archaeon]